MLLTNVKAPGPLVLPMTQYTHVLFYFDPLDVIFLKYISSDIFISNQRLFQRHWF